MKFEAMLAPVAPPPDIQVTMDRETAEVIRALAGKTNVTGVGSPAEKIYRELGLVLYGSPYATGKYRVKAESSIVVSV